MADTTTPIQVSSSDASSPPSSAADQARIRKERREAKIKAGGSARLNKITGLGGGVERVPPPQPSGATTLPSGDASVGGYVSSHAVPQGSSRRAAADTRSPSSPSAQAQAQAQQLCQTMLDLGPPPADNDTSGMPMPSANPFAAFPGMGTGLPRGPGTPGAPGADGSAGNMAEDPMMRMLQQVMGGMGGTGADGAALFPGQDPSAAASAAATADPYAYLWRVVHAVFALTLGMYIALTTTFTGSKFDRDASGTVAFSESGASSSSSSGGGGRSLSSSAGSVRFFYIFATVEIILQTSRFFVEKRSRDSGRQQQQQPGIMGMVVGFLPEPYKGYVLLASRYLKIWSTVSEDAMVCVFILGVCCWLRTS